MTKKKLSEEADESATRAVQAVAAILIEAGVSIPELAGLANHVIFHWQDNERSAFERAVGLVLVHALNRMKPEILIVAKNSMLDWCERLANDEE